MSIDQHIQFIIDINFIDINENLRVEKTDATAAKTIKAAYCCLN